MVFMATRGLSASKSYFRNDETESWEGHMICLGHAFGGGAKNWFLGPQLAVPRLCLLG